MNNLLEILGALVVVVIPLLLAWLLLGRGDRARPPRRSDTDREKMPR
jgi:hypothetical protein